MSEKDSPEELRQFAVDNIASIDAELRMVKLHSEGLQASLNSYLKDLFSGAWVTSDGSTCVVIDGGFAYVHVLSDVCIDAPAEETPQDVSIEYCTNKLGDAYCALQVNHSGRCEYTIVPDKPEPPENIVLKESEYWPEENKPLYCNYQSKLGHGRVCRLPLGHDGCHEFEHVSKRENYNDS